MNTGNPEPKRRWFQFSLRMLLVLIAVVAIGCGWVAYELNQARQQRQIVAAIRHLGGDVDYDCHDDPSKLNAEWLVETFGLDFCNDVVRVTFRESNGTTFGDADLEQSMKYLRGLPHLGDSDLAFTSITDAGLKQLPLLTNLKYISLLHTAVTAAGVEDLKSALPHTMIHQFLP
jgi:hypothetical protein